MSEQVKEDWQLTLMDRCDSCGAQAYVQTRGLSGKLLFCSHHYNEIMSSPSGYEKMMAFAISIVDEREKLIENRTKGEN